MIKAIIFDIGGVLLRTEDRRPREQLEKRLGLAAGEAERLVFNSEMGQMAQNGRISNTDLWAWLGAHLSLNSDELIAFQEEFWGGDVLDERLVDLIRLLKLSYKTAVISNATDDLLPALARHRFADAFDLIVGSAGEKVMKPNAAIYERTLERLDVDADETLFVDDFAHNVAAARALGMHGIHFNPAISLYAELAALGVTVPRLPAGYTVREGRMEDLETAVALFNICNIDQIGVSEFILNDVKNEWKTPKFDLARSTRAVFSPNGALVGYVEVWDIVDPPVRIWVWARVHPEHEGRGIGTWLTSWAEARAHLAISRVDDNISVIMQAGGYSAHQPTLDLLQEYGMSLTRHFWKMVTPLDSTPPSPQWPDNIIIRTMADLPDLRSVCAAEQDAFQDHWGYVPRDLEEELERWQHWIDNDEKFDPTLWFLAMDGDEIAGISLCRSEAQDDATMGWVDALGVRRAWRRKGIALALLHHTFVDFHKRGQKSVGLGVDAASLTGATRLYEKAGMVMDDKFTFATYEKELRAGRVISRE